MAVAVVLAVFLVCGFVSVGSAKSAPDSSKKSSGKSTQGPKKNSPAGKNNGKPKPPAENTTSYPSSNLSPVEIQPRDCRLQEGRYWHSLRFTDSTLDFPFYTNFNCPSEAVERAVIVVHGMNRNADDYFQDIRLIVPMLQPKTSGVDWPDVSIASTEHQANQTQKSGTSFAASGIPVQSVLNSSTSLAPVVFEKFAMNSGTTVIVAPKFLICSSGENPCDAEVSPDDPHYYYWSTNDGWKSGMASAAALANSGYGPRKSSFEFMDELLFYLKGRYPNLRYVTVAGHSAGGQFVQRYAATTRSLMSLAYYGIEVHFVVANPSSYVYLDPMRWVDGAWQVPKSPGCNYDHYRYGLGGGLSSLFYQYILDTGVDYIRAMYPMNKVVYLLGENDTSTGGNLDGSCEANWQGANRLERGETYYNYINDHYPGHNHEIGIVPGVGHHHGNMFTSPLGRAKILWW